VNQPLHLLGRLLNAFHLFHRGRVLRQPAQHQLRADADCAERIPEIVRDHGEHVVPHLHGMLCLVVKLCILQRQRRTHGKVRGQRKVPRIVRARCRIETDRADRAPAAEQRRQDQRAETELLVHATMRGVHRHRFELRSVHFVHEYRLARLHGAEHRMTRRLRKRIVIQAVQQRLPRPVGVRHFQPL
jgi:hypothetical protein